MARSIGKRLAVMTAVCVVGALMAAPGASAADASAAGGHLYLLQATNGAIEGSKLVLRGVDPRVTSFTDRPQRSAGSLTEKSFADGWGKLFGNDPPNAALEVQGAPTSRDVALLVLRHPRYDAAARTLTYSVRRLRKTGDGALASFDRRADGDAVRRFGRSSLFIDDGGGQAAPLKLRFKVPAQAEVKLTFDNAVPELQGDGVDLTNLVESPGGGESPSADIAVTPEAILVANAGGGTIELQMSIFLLAQPGEEVTGVATLRGGASVAVENEVAPEQAIAAGPFSFPLE